MGAFEYSALTGTGRERNGVLEGDTPRQIRQQLREQGLVPLRVEEVAQRERGTRRRRGFRRGISAADLSLVTRQLATLVRSGLPVEESLGTVSRQAEKGRIKSLLMGVRGRVVEGRSLADGLADFPHVFDDLYRATVDAGEQSGHLDIVLERLADYTESRQQLRQKTQLALLYPAILTLMSVVVVVALLSYVVPQVVQVFASTGQTLPWLTRALIGTSDFLRSYFLVLGIGIFGGVAIASWTLRKPGPKRAMHRSLLNLPMIGKFVRGSNTARFARTLSILVASGVPVLDALRISAQVITNLPMRTAVETAATRVREGTSLSAAVNKSGFFPPIVTHLIGSGEASGNLEDMLERAAVNQERELETRIATLLGVFEPVLILVMGGVVLVIVLAILLPIFELNQLVQ